MALDESSFRRPGSVPFKWELQPGIPKQPAATNGTTAMAAAAAAPSLLLPPRLALPPAAAAASRRVSKPDGALASRSSSCQRSCPVSATSLAPPLLPPSHSQSSLSQSSTTRHRRSMSARFATSLALPFTRPRWRGRSKDENEAADDDDVAFSVLYGDKMIV